MGVASSNKYTCTHLGDTAVFQDFAIFNRKPSSVVHACVLSNMRLIAY